MGNTVEATEWFTYLGLGSAIDSSGRSSQMFTAALDWPPAAWTDSPISGGSPGSRLSLSTELRLYNVYVVSVLSYGCETLSVATVR